MIVPSALRKEMLQLLHEPHFDIGKTKQRARQIFYWLNMTLDIESFVKCCEICQVNRKAQQKEILINHEIPSCPWQFVFSDFFECNRKNYLLLVYSLD